MILLVRICNPGGYNLRFAKAEMLIRKPVSEVFDAFVNPEITAKFWFTKSSGRLKAGKEIQWDWERYNHSIKINVKAIEENKRSSSNGLQLWNGFLLRGQTTPLL